MGDAEAQRAAEEIIDPEHRLPGEEESEQSPLLEDAQHWEQVYAELVGFKRDLLDAMEGQREQTDHEAVTAEVEKDQTVLESELRRLTGRHQYWSEQVRRRAGSTR